MVREDMINDVDIMRIRVPEFSKTNTVLLHYSRKVMIWVLIIFCAVSLCRR